MRSRTLLATSIVLVLGALVAPVAGAAVPGTAPVNAKGATRAGAYSARSTSVTVALAPRAGLDALLARQASGKSAAITSKRFNARFAPSAATVRSVRAFARTHSLSVRSVSANRMLVRLAGSSSAVAKAFHTSFATFKLPGGATFHGPTRAAKVPAAFRSHTAAVLGLSNIGRVQLRAGTVSIPSDYGPQDLWSLYNAPASATGSGQAVAIITEGDVSKPKADLVTFENQFGLPVVPWNTVQVGPQTTDTAGNDEWDLDSQYSTGLAPNVSALYDYNGGSLSNDDIAATVTRWVTDNTTRQASFSAGECETLAQVTGFQTTLDNTLKQATAQGQTLFTSSGDTGSFCPAGPAGVNGVPAGVPGVEYPAASPYAIGVGGTTVVGPGPNEVAWYAGGGGATYFEDVPTWQQNAGGSFVGVDRGVPDVALDADPLSGYRVIVDGTEETIGGTSASAPAWQGIWARAQGAKGGALGFAGPVIYTAEPATAFHDITVGAIGTYLATPGWDYTTGRGTPDITAFVNGAH
jgi:pseudomonalisin